MDGGPIVDITTLIKDFGLPLAIAIMAILFSRWSILKLISTFEATIIRQDRQHDALMSKLDLLLERDKGKS